MNSQEIQDVLTVSRIINELTNGPATFTETVAAVLDWRDGSSAAEPLVLKKPEPEPEPVAKAKAAKATRKAPAKAAADDDEPAFEPSPDPSADDEPDF